MSEAIQPRYSANHEPHRREPRASTSAVPARAEEANGPKASESLQKLCGSINDVQCPPSGPKGLLRKSTQTLEVTLGRAAACKPKPIDGDATRLCRLLESHQGPVIVLDPKGKPEYVFEWQNGRWESYSAVTFRPVQVPSPGELLDGLNHQGTTFTAFRLDGCKIAGFEDKPTTRQPIVIQYRASDSTKHKKAPERGATRLDGPPPEHRTGVRYAWPFFGVRRTRTVGDEESRAHIETVDDEVQEEELQRPRTRTNSTASD